MDFVRFIVILSAVYGQIITGFNAKEKVVAFTFDACETVTPAYFDKELLNYIVANRIPVTLFLSGKFIERNREEVERLSRYDFIEIENHSYSHSNFATLGSQEIIEDITKNGEIIRKTTGRLPLFFRFPYGEYKKDDIDAIEKLGYKIVHWSFPSGDPDKSLTKVKLIKGVVNRVKAGDILIFHINGRGWKTKEAFPMIVETLKERGYKFSLIRDVIN